MLLCRSCGQSKHISDDNFIAYQSVSGTETLYVSNEDGYEVLDYGDTNTDSDGINEWQCPHCDSNSIDLDSEATQEECIELRKNYEERVQLRQKERQRIIAESNKWDS